MSYYAWEDEESMKKTLGGKYNLVTVTMARNNIFEWQKAPSFQGYLLSSPRGSGDVFRLLIGEKEILLNGNSSEFVAMEIIYE
jgi:hypothetical protein